MPDYRRAWHLGGTSHPLAKASKRPAGNDGIVRDDEDFRAHMDYIHINPVKHGYVERVRDWPYFTFRRLVREGSYSLDWGGGREDSVCTPD